MSRANELNQQFLQAYRDNRFEDALPPAKEALAIREKALGPDDLNLAVSLNNLADTYRMLGRYAEAEPLFKRSLSVYEKAGAADKIGVTTVLTNLARVYSAEGRYADAEPLFERSLAVAEKVLGPDDSQVAQKLGGLATLYTNMGRYADAEPLYKRSLAINEKALGPDDVNVAVRLNDLAELYRLQDRYAEAEPLYKRCIAIDEKALGPDNPQVAIALSNLGLLYNAQGRYAEAEPLYKRSIDIDEKALGPDHPMIAIVSNNLALLYTAQARYADAELLFKRSIEISKKAYGPEHLNVARATSNLGDLYRTEGRYADAEPLYQQSFGILKKALGPGHRDVATSLGVLAQLYHEEGRYAEAERLYNQSLEINEKALGPDDPAVAANLVNIGALYIDEGRYADAEPLYKRALAIDQKALGPNHPSFATDLNNLGMLYSDEGFDTQAEALYKRSLAIREKALGPDHPDVAVSLNNLATICMNEHRYADAEPLLQRSLAIREKTLGPDHPDVAVGLNNLAAVYVDENRDAEAEPLYKRSLAINEKALGPDHPNVAFLLDDLARLYRDQKRFTEARDFSRRAVAIIAKQSGAATGGSADNAATRRSQRGYFLDNVAMVTDVADPSCVAETFGVVQLANASSAAQAVAGMAARFAAGGDALAALVRERQDLADRSQTLNKSVLAAAMLPPAKQDAAAADALRKQATDVTTQLTALDTRIGREFPKYTELSNPKPVELSAVQALLAPDEALLVYLIGNKDRSWLWAIRNDRAYYYKLDINAQTLSDDVAQLRQRLDPDRNADKAPFDTKLSYGLYQQILAPAASALDGAHNLFVVTDGALDSLPLGVLVAEEPQTEPQGNADYRKVHWLARDYASTVLPSVGALCELRQFANADHATDPFVGIGNPLLADASGQGRGAKPAGLFRGSMADVDAVRELPSLPETADELRAVASDMGVGDNDLYLADRATEPLLRQADLGRFRVIEFATHGLMSGDLPGLAEPALVLTPPAVASADNDGLLTVSKIATLKLNADWVVLSACNTAASDGTPDAGGLSGLAKAFFYAGSRSLLVSNWAVPSSATVKLITGAFDALKKSPAIGRAEALRRAEMAMLDADPPDFAHPMMWAPFILAGEGGAGH
ncbi:MAG TPA: tetratricopeptide repeat protein [Stellaceae bacterium]|nr:tetratricopeptide repeat protein [Stellaceae bacterium]